MTAFLGGVRLQAAMFRRAWDNLLALITVPLFTIAFLAITRHAGRTDLAAYAVIGPAVVAVLGMAILTSGEVVASDRYTGVIELNLATPSPLAVVVLGRIFVVTFVSLIGVLEALLVARLLFGVVLRVPHPMQLTGVVVLAVLAMAGTALVMAAVFVAARSARTFQNTISYPLYLLGGAFVPVALLPGWMHPVARVVFLSWATDLMRDCMAAAPVPDYWPRMGIVAGLGAASFVAGFIVLARVIDRARATGQVGHE